MWSQRRGEGHARPLGVISPLIMTAPMGIRLMDPVRLDTVIVARSVNLRRYLRIQSRCRKSSATNSANAWDIDPGLILGVLNYLTA